MAKQLQDAFGQAMLASALIMAAGCSSSVSSRDATGMDIVPALSLVKVELERTVFQSSSSVSGSVAQAQRDLRIATPAAGRLRRETTGTMPTEVQIEISSISTTNRNVEIQGSVNLRDTRLGRTMATLENFSASGPLPLVAPGGNTDGIIFRGVEDEILVWLASLDCDAVSTSCGIDLLPDVPDVPAPEEIEDADLDLETLVGNRPSGVRALNSAGINPRQVVAAATPLAPAGPDIMAIGSTVASLGLLNRSGFWLSTPLVTEETPGKIMDSANGVMLPVTLIPNGGAPGSASQLSLAAIAELGREPTDLITIDVLQ